MTATSCECSAILGIGDLSNGLMNTDTAIPYYVIILLSTFTAELKQLLCAVSHTACEWCYLEA